jgi:hypothetical protein
MTDHADFVAADEGYRWTLPLTELGAFLREKAWKAKGGWVYRILPGGACVAMRMIDGGPDAFKRELRVSRREKIETFEQYRKWVGECKVFRRHLECEHGWHTLTICGREQGATFEPGHPTEWTTREDEPLRRPRAERVELKCVKCGNPAEQGSDKYKETICNKCALEAGRAEQATLDLQGGKQ